MTNTCECDNASTRFSIVAFSVAANVEFAASIVMSLDLTILCTCRFEPKDVDASRACAENAPASQCRERRR